MKALLIDVDSTIPNLALMHISTWRKSLGYETGFNISDPDEVWASVIFKANRHRTNWYVYLHNDATYEDALERCNILRGLNALPYIMVNRDSPRTQRMTDLKRWTRPQIFFSVPFDMYRAGVRARDSARREQE